MTSGTNSNSGIHSLYNFYFFCKQNIAKRMLYIGLKFSSNSSKRTRYVGLKFRQFELILILT